MRDAGQRIHDRGMWAHVDDSEAGHRGDRVLGRKEKASRQTEKEKKLDRSVVSSLPRLNYKFLNNKAEILSEWFEGTVLIELLGRIGYIKKRK